MNSITHFFENQDSIGSSWQEVRDLIFKSTCNARRQNSDCEHERCSLAHDLLDKLDSENLTQQDMVEIYHFIHSKSCGSMRDSGICFHPACRTNKRHADWIADKISSATSAI